MSTTTEIFALDIDYDFILHLVIPESVQAIRAERLSPEVLEDDLARDVYDWQIKHLREHGTIASASVLEDQFEYISIEDPQTSIGDLIGRLRERYARNEGRDALRHLAKLAGENPTAIGAEMLRAGKKLTDISSQRGDQFGTGEIIRALDVYTAKVERGPGPSLGFDAVDAHFHGIQGVTSLLAPPKTYKALALDTPIPIPSGWTTIEDLAIGDKVFDETGQRCCVRTKSPVWHDRPCFEVKFSDGTSIIADQDHLWQTSQREKGVGVRTTQEIKNSLKRSDNGSNHSIPICQPLAYTKVDLPIHPYVLGVWLGDGISREGVISNTEASIIANVEECGYQISRWPSNPSNYTIRGIVGQLRKLGVLNNKHIPDLYLHSEIHQRLELLRGLMDTDGSCSKKGESTLVTTIPALKDTSMELVRSLGYKPIPCEYRAVLDGRDCGPKWHILFCAHKDQPIYKLERKASLQRSQSQTKSRSKSRQIIDIVPIDSVPVQCIGVDSPNHLYLAGLGMIPTHNSWFGVNGTIEQVIKGGRPKLYSLELPAEDTHWRILCMAANVPFWKYERGALTNEEQARIAEASTMLDECGTYSVDKPPPGERSAQVLVERALAEDATCIFVDQLQYVENEKGTNLGTLNDTGYYWEVMSLFRDYSDEVPIFVVHQFNRSTMGAKEMPEMQQAKGSSAIEETSHLMLGLWANKEMRKNNIIEVGTLASRSYSYKNWHVEVGLTNDCRMDMLGEVTDDDQE